MAYISTEKVKEIRAKLKSEFPTKDGWNFSISQSNHSSLNVQIITAPIDLNVDRIEQSQIYLYCLDKYTHTDIYNRIKEISYNGDYYFNLEIGKWDKDFIYIAPDIEEETVLEDVDEKTYTQEEVDFLLKEQRKQSAFAIGLSSSVMTYPSDYDKFKDIIERSNIDSIDLIENYFKK